jgi:hypothetical protein
MNSINRKNNLKWLCRNYPFLRESYAIAIPRKKRGNLDVHFAFPANNIAFLLDVMAIYMCSEGDEELE